MAAEPLVVVSSFLNAVDAEMALSALEAARIEAIARHDDCGGMRPQLAMGGVDILVRVEDAQRAAEVLSSVSAAEIPDRPEE